MQTDQAAPAPRFADPTALGLFGLAIGCASLLPIAFGVIVFTIAITGLYVRRANSEYDRLTAQILEDAAR